jgi:hypothetical protein
MLLLMARHPPPVARVAQFGPGGGFETAEPLPLLRVGEQPQWPGHIAIKNGVHVFKPTTQRTTYRSFFA